MNDDRVRPMAIATRIGVHPVTVLRWIREGRLSAVKVGRNYFISRVEADVFADAYVRRYGEPLSPDIPGRPTGYRAGRVSARGGDGRQSFYVTMPTAILRMVDAERRQEEDRVSRSDFVEAAVGHYINARKNARRMQEIRERAS